MLVIPRHKLHNNLAITAKNKVALYMKIGCFIV